MAHTAFPAIFRDTSLLVPAPAGADREVIGVDPATGYQVLSDGHFHPATVPDDVKVRKAEEFAEFMNTLARRLRARISATGSASWEDECKALTSRNVIEEFAGYIYRRDLRDAEALQNVLLAQREDRIAGRPLPEWKNDGPARPVIRQASHLGAVYRGIAAKLSSAAA